MFGTMKLSVVVITRNAEEFMYDCLDSLVHQSVKPEEVLVVDANSSDKTPFIVKEYSVKWPGAFSSGTLDSPKSFFTIHCERDESYNVVTCSFGESYVLKAYGDFNLGTNSLTVTIDHIDYFEKVKREGLKPVVPDPLADFPIEFTVTFG